MAELFNAMTIAFAVTDVVFAIRVLRGEGIKSRDNRWFALYCLAGAIWSFFFGELIIQTDEEIAYLCRCAGLVGVFLSFVFITFLFCSWSQLPKPILSAMKAFSLLGFIVYPYNIKRDGIIFHHTSYGLSYEFVRDVWTDIFMIYTIAIAAVFVVLLMYMQRRGSKKRYKHISYWCFFALTGLLVGDVLDTLLPLLGYAAIPGSTIMQFVATCVVFTAVNYSNKTKLTVANSAGFLFHSVRAAVLVYDEKTRLVQASDEAVKLLGLENAIGTMTHIDDIFDCDYVPFAEGENVRVIEAHVHGRDTACGVEINKLFDDYGDVFGYMVFVYDMTERQHFVEELQKARDRADEANQAKSSFLANMSHEIRTPINTVLGMNEMIRRETQSDDIRGYSENIRVAGEALLSIINDILDFSKVEAGKIEIVDAEYSFGEMLGGLINMFDLKSREKGLAFITDIDPNLPSGLLGDEIRVRQVLMNLLNNAVKYTEEGSVTFRVTDGGRTGENISLVFEIKDTGIGIREEDKATLFDSFRRLDNKQTHHIEGTGLGLSIVKELTDLMQADLTVDSIYGAGSVFKFTLTQTVTDVAPLGDPMRYAEGLGHEITEYHASFTAPDAYVLVVDDNRMNLAVIAGLLKNTGIHLDLAESGRECLDRIKHRKYDVILMDHMMPSMDGIETLQHMREMDLGQNLSSEAKVVALTANAISGSREKYISLGFNDYLSKPVECDKLEAMLRKLLPESLVKEGELVLNQAETSEDVALRNKLLAADLDADSGMNYCGTMEVYATTALAFCDMAEDACNKLANYRRQRTVDSYRIAIHGIKANARTLGCDTLFRLALRQEEECKEGVFDHIMTDGDRPEKMIRSLKQNLEAIFADPAKPQTTPNDKRTLVAADPAVIKEIIEKAIGFAEEFDDSTALGELDKLQKYSLAEDIADAVSKAYSKLKTFDYDDAIEILRGITD